MWQWVKSCNVRGTQHLQVNSGWTAEMWQWVKSCNVRGTQHLQVNSGWTAEMWQWVKSCNVTGAQHLQVNRNRKVARSIPDGVIGIFHWHNPSGRTMAPGLTQPLTEMNTRCISWGKGGQCVGLTTLLPPCADCLEIWEPQPPGPSGPVQACNGIALP